MLRALKAIINYRIQATDGEIGHLREVHFDDVTWAVRYLIVDTGKWLPGKKVHLSTMACDGQPKWNERTIPVLFNKQMIKLSPDIDSDKPVSRQKEN